MDGWIDTVYSIQYCQVRVVAGLYRIPFRWGRNSNVICKLHHA